jgi:hypothetical protein
MEIGDLTDMRLARTNEDGSEEPEQDIAIKKVLQDKRFKVGCVTDRSNQY